MRLIDAISRQAAITEFSCCELTPDGGIDANYAIDFLERLPSAQPQRIKGHWIKKMNVTGNNGDIIYRPEWYCSQCRSKYDPNMAQRINFCCACGADMKGE